MTENTYKVARVKWVDTTHSPGWHKAHEIEALFKAPLPVMESVGWLVHNSDDVVVLAQSIGDSAMADLYRIPRALIVDMWIDKSETKP